MSSTTKISTVFSRQYKLIIYIPVMFALVVINSLSSLSFVCNENIQGLIPFKSF